MTNLVFMENIPSQSGFLFLPGHLGLLVQVKVDAIVDGRRDVCKVLGVRAGNVEFGALLIRDQDVCVRFALEGSRWVVRGESGFC
jgi:hypothetical protein